MARYGRYFLYSLLLAGLVGGYFYGPDLYYRLLGNSLFRLTDSNIKLGEKIQARKSSPSDLLKKINENKKIVSILLRSSPSNPEILYQRTLLDYYELILRMPLDAHHLLKLSGRGYLPVLRNIEGSTSKPTSTALSLRISRNLRKVLAIEPEFPKKNQVLAMLVFTDFIYSGRLEPKLLERLDLLSYDDVPKHLRSSSEWLFLALYTLSANIQKQTQLLGFLVLQGKQPRAADKSGSIKETEQEYASHFTLSSTEAELLRCYALYYAKRYFQAWKIARTLKRDSSLPLSYRVEAARMEAEIFLLQRGKKSALYHLNEAWELSEKKDSFIEERIKELSKE